MQKKTFIKVRRGILEAKHIQALGVRFAYYLLLLDWANWETGSVIDYRDQDAADQTGYSKRTIREWRTQLEKDGYIQCLQGQHNQEIIINKWKNPRGKGDINPLPSAVQGVRYMSPSREKLAQGDIQGDIQGGNEHGTLPYSSDIRHQNKDINTLSEEQNRKFIGFLQMFAGEAFNSYQIRLIEEAPKRLIEGTIQVFFDGNNFGAKKTFESINKYILPKPGIKEMQFFDEIECVTIREEE